MGDERGARIERIPLSAIRPRKFPSRAAPSEPEVQRLAASIRVHGLLQPLLVRVLGREYEIVCGQRRYQACKALGHPEVVAVVRMLDDRQAFEISLAENARRDPLSVDERREILRRLMAMYPGRPREELEAWLGPVETPASGEPLLNWLETLEQKDAKAEQVAVVVAGKGKTAAVEVASPPSHAGPPPVPVAGPPGSGDTKVLVNPSSAPPSGVTMRQGLVWRVRTLLNKLTKSGSLDHDLLENIVAELTHRLDHQPLHEYLDLSHHGNLKRYVSRHCLNVSKLAMFLARSLGMGSEDVREVAICGLLHDVGMMKVKQEVFTKHAALDQEEWEQVKGHPIEGALLLTKEVVLRDVVARVALEHHEKPDGTGYPAGKKKAETHVYARLINVVDTYGAMVSPRAHRLPMLPYQAMRVVMDEGAKGMLDWDIVQSFLKAVSMYPIGSYLRLEGGEIARVVRSQPEIPEKPVIAVIADAQRNILRTPVEIDLAMTEPMPTFEPIPSPI
jgi:putative nucleotidyltransferase with HDIG domain